MKAFVLEHAKQQVEHEATRNAVVQEGNRIRSYFDDAENKRRFFDSFVYPEMNKRKNDVHDAYPETFKWIFDDEVAHSWSSFSQFLLSDQKWYWIWGKPGSGKSCLMKYILSQPKTVKGLKTWRTKTRIISHFIWAAGASKLQKQRKGILLSLIVQLLEELYDKIPSLPCITSRWSSLRSKKTVDDWDEHALKSVILDLLKSRGSGHGILIMIDGLDEIDPCEGFHKTMEFLEEIASVDCIKLCVASRPELALQPYLTHKWQLRLQDLTRKDMAEFATQKLQRLCEHHGFDNGTDTADFEKTIDVVLEKAEGVFLWLVYTFRSLENEFLIARDWNDLQKVLEDLPSEMEDLYRMMLQKLGSGNPRVRENARWLFRHFLNDNFLNNAYGLLYLTLKWHDAICSAVLEDAEVKDWQELSSFCTNTKKKSIFYCAGLVEYRESVETELTLSCYHLSPFLNSRIERISQRGEQLLRSHNLGHMALIHRSARDFLLQEGYLLDPIESDANQLRQRFRLTVALGICFDFKLGHGFLDYLTSVLDELASIRAHSLFPELLQTILGPAKQVSVRNGNDRNRDIAYLISLENFGDNDIDPSIWDLLSYICRRLDTAHPSVLQLLQGKPIDPAYLNHLISGVSPGRWGDPKWGCQKLVNGRIGRLEVLRLLFDLGASLSHHRLVRSDGYWEPLYIPFTLVQDLLPRWMPISSNLGSIEAELQMEAQLKEYFLQVLAFLMDSNINLQGKVLTYVCLERERSHPLTRYSGEDCYVYDLLIESTIGNYLEIAANFLDLGPAFADAIENVNRRQESSFEIESNPQRVVATERRRASIHSDTTGECFYPSLAQSQCILPVLGDLYSDVPGALFVLFDFDISLKLDFANKRSASRIYISPNELKERMYDTAAALWAEMAEDENTHLQPGGLPQAISETFKDVDVWNEEQSAAYFKSLGWKPYDEIVKSDHGSDDKTVLVRDI